MLRIMEVERSKMEGYGSSEITDDLVFLQFVSGAIKIEMKWKDQISLVNFLKTVKIELNKMYGVS